MTKKIIFIIVVILAIAFLIKMSNKNKTDLENTNIGSNQSEVEVVPVTHASLVLKWEGKALYADPVGEEKLFLGLPNADIIFLTDIHQDHFNVDRLKALAKDQTIIIAPQAVADKIPSELSPKVIVMNNGETREDMGFTIEAIPAYNLPGASENFHTKGRGNGYVIERDGTRVYISGDTAGVPEMRSLKDIDMAFVCMNLPYTMDVEEAVSAVLEFKPAKVYPYHFRTPDGFSDVAKFKQLVNEGGSDIEVVQLEWYVTP